MEKLIKGKIYAYFREENKYLDWKEFKITRKHHKSLGGLVYGFKRSLGVAYELTLDSDTILRIYRYVSLNERFYKYFLIGYVKGNPVKNNVLIDISVENTSMGVSDLAKYFRFIESYKGKYKEYADKKIEKQLMFKIYDSLKKYIENKSGVKSEDNITLDEAIKHAEEKANELSCSSCGAEHKQLAEWLKELKLLRNIKL